MPIDLEVELDRYDEWTCPDYLFLAWRILFASSNPPDRKTILDQARADLVEREEVRRQRIFDSNRRQMEDLVKLPWNW